MRELGIGMSIVSIGIGLFVGVIYALVYMYQPIRVYIADTYTKTIVLEKEALGKAQLLQALNERKVAVETAKAKDESAKYEAQAEITRAKGVAEANRIIGDSLKSNEAYLRYLWIDKLNQNEQNVIYVPTEAGLPILEAGKR
jgi:xanthosine utilization system XapX-like protein